MAYFLALRSSNIKHVGYCYETPLGYGKEELYPEIAQAIREDHAMFEKQPLRDNLPDVSDKMRAWTALRGKIGATAICNS